MADKPAKTQQERRREKLAELALELDGTRRAGGRVIMRVRHTSLGVFVRVEKIEELPW